MVLSSRISKTLKRHSRNDSIKFLQKNSLARLGHFGLLVEESGQVKDKQNGAVRLLLRRSLKKQAKHWATYTIQKSKTKKPNETRLGKGKGSVKYWYYTAPSGSLLFEISYQDINKIRPSAKNLAQRLSFKTALWSKCDRWTL